MAKNPILLTPYGIANYPHINKPDTEGQYADNKYKTKLNLSKADMAKFQAAFKEAVGTIPKNYKLPWGERDGVEFVNAKSQYAPKVTFTANAEQTLEEGQYVGGGSKIALAVEVYDYDKGFSLRLKEVRVKELVSGGNSYFSDEDEEAPVQEKATASLDI